MKLPNKQLFLTKIKFKLKTHSDTQVDQPIHFRVNRLPVEYTPKTPPYKVGDAKIYVDEETYYVEDPDLSQEAITAYRDILDKKLRWLPPELFDDDQKLIEAISSTQIDTQTLLYYIRRELKGYSILQPLIDDPSVEDIVIAAPNTPVSVKYRGRTLKTNITFNQAELNELAQRLAAMAGKPVSTYNPLLSVRLPDGNRLTLNYGLEVSHRGTSIALRKFPANPWSITQLLQLGSVVPDVLAWLWILIENRKALLVCGTSGVGKTSLINALTCFIPNNARIVTVEDTGEFKLSHPYWTPLIARYSYTQNKYAEISLDQLVKHALRMSADYIIVGEVRGEEGASWAQSVLTGHGGLTSIHSETPELATQRLVSPPINVEPQSLSALHAVVEVRATGTKRYISSVLDYEYHPQNPVFKRVYQAGHPSNIMLRDEDILDLPTSKLLIDQGVYTPSELLEELRMRRELLEVVSSASQVDPELLTHDAVSKISWAYQANPELRAKPSELLRTIRPLCPNCSAPLRSGGSCPMCGEAEELERAITV
ncbi:MAG TPA: type II/IV secretion system ATPase subunit [bacterium]|nr:type II/IV secretion system ATPase subunit [bacterium]